MLHTIKNLPIITKLLSLFLLFGCVAILYFGIKESIPLQCGDDIVVKTSNRIFDGAEYYPTKITFRSLDGTVLEQDKLDASRTSWCLIPNDIDPVIRVIVEYVECGSFVQRSPKKRTVELEISTFIGSDNGISWYTLMCMPLFVLSFFAFVTLLLMVLYYLYGYCF